MGEQADSKTPTSRTAWCRLHCATTVPVPLRPRRPQSPIASGSSRNQLAPSCDRFSHPHHRAARFPGGVASRTTTTAASGEVPVTQPKTRVRALHRHILAAPVRRFVPEPPLFCAPAARRASCHLASTVGLHLDDHRPQPQDCAASIRGRWHRIIAKTHYDRTHFRPVWLLQSRQLVRLLRSATLLKEPGWGVGSSASKVSRAVGCVVEPERPPRLGGSSRHAPTTNSLPTSGVGRWMDGSAHAGVAARARRDRRHKPTQPSARPWPPSRWQP